MCESKEVSQALAQCLFTWHLPLSLCTLYHYRGQCNISALRLSHFLHEICVPQSAYITIDKCGLNCSPAVGVSLILQPNCLDLVLWETLAYVLSGVSWTRVGIWHINHLDLPPVTHQTVSSTTLSPFEFSARHVAASKWEFRSGPGLLIAVLYDF